MREILFRGKRKDNGEWVYGDLLSPLKSEPAVIVDGGWLVPVIPETVGQYIGLEDKNGRKIFEGDIVCKRDLTFKTELVGVVMYNSAIGCFCIHSESKGITTRTGFEASDVYNDGQCTVPVRYNYEVIGNIYETKIC